MMIIYLLKNFGMIEMILNLYHIIRKNMYHFFRTIKYDYGLRNNKDKIIFNNIELRFLDSYNFRSLN